MKKTLSRRNFLKTMGAGATAIAAAGVFGPAAFAEDSPAAEGPSGDGPDPSMMAPAAQVSDRYWRTAPDPIPESEIVAEYTADVVILGAGHAGASCARSAAENGATVILVDTMSEDSYNVNGDEYGCVNSEEMISRWGYERIDEGEVFNDWLLRNQYRCNPSFVREYVQNSGKTLDWLFEVCDEDLISNFTTAGYPGPKYFTGNHMGQKAWASTLDLNGESGEIHMRGIQKMLSLNPENRMLWETSAEQLIKEDGKVVAAIVSDANGYIRLNANKGVVVATGGFADNVEMLNEIYTNLKDCFPASIRDKADPSSAFMGRYGIGHQMCIWAGGVFEPDEPASMVTHPSGNNPFNGVKSAFSCVWLNGEGKRYTPEQGDYQLTGVPGRYGKANDDASYTVITVFDSSIVEDLQYGAPGHSASCINDMYAGETYAAAIEESMKACYEAGAEGYNAGGMGAATTYAADTVEQLADYLGLDETVKANMVAEIEKYNTFCANGVDTDFYKDPSLLRPLEPPFYGKIGTQKLTMTLTTLAGIWTDDNQCVITDETHEPIEGLYATGNVCGRRWIGQYSTSIAGESISMACTMGKKLGAYLANL